MSATFCSVGNLLQPRQNRIDAVWLCHEFLEAFHTGLGHVGGCVTVKELGESIGARQFFKTSLDEWIIANGLLVVDGQLSKHGVHLGLGFG